MKEQLSARQLLAQKLKLLRFIYGWSQEALANTSGLHRTYISAIEREQCNISLDNLERLAKAFKLSTSELLCEPQEQEFLQQWEQKYCEEEFPDYGSTASLAMH